jgi:hypothetical protein
MRVVYESNIGFLTSDEFRSAAPTTLGIHFLLHFIRTARALACSLLQRYAQNTVVSEACHRVQRHASYSKNLESSGDFSSCGFDSHPGHQCDFFQLQPIRSFR